MSNVGPWIMRSEVSLGKFSGTALTEIVHNLVLSLKVGFLVVTVNMADPEGKYIQFLQLGLSRRFPATHTSPTLASANVSGLWTGSTSD